MQANKTLENKRLSELDAVRGFALFGVLLVNLTMVVSVMSGGIVSPFSHDDLLNRFSALLINVFAEGKFYTLFAILFGASFKLFIDQKNNGTSLFKRRLLVLFIIGIAHLIFVWYGDILHVYAVTGAVLLANHRQTKERKLKVAIALFIFSTLLFAWANSVSQTYTDTSATTNAALAVFTQGTYFEVLEYRMKLELPNLVFNLPFVFTRIYGLFIFGSLLIEYEVLQKLRNQVDLQVKFWQYALATSAILASIKLVLESNAASPFLTHFISEWLTLSLALFYGLSILRLHYGGFQMKWLQSMGRMALTHYLFQTVCFTTLYYGYGGGFYETLPFYATIPLAISIYAIQGTLGSFWLKRFKQGPVEYVWRIITYGKSRKAA